MKKKMKKTLITKSTKRREEAYQEAKKNYLLNMKNGKLKKQLLYLFKKTLKVTSLEKDTTKCYNRRDSCKLSAKNKADSSEVKKNSPIIT